MFVEKYTTLKCNAYSWITTELHTIYTEHEFISDTTNSKIRHTFVLVFENWL